MTDGKTRAEIANFDALLADPADNEKELARQGQIQQEELNRRMAAAGMFVPPPPKQRVHRRGPEGGE